MPAITVPVAACSLQHVTLGGHTSANRNNNMQKLVQIEISIEVRSCRTRIG